MQQAASPVVSSPQPGALMQCHKMALVVRWGLLRAQAALARLPSRSCWRARFVCSSRSASLYHSEPSYCERMVSLLTKPCTPPRHHQMRRA